MYRNNPCLVPDYTENYPKNEVGRPVDEIVVDQFMGKDFMLAENGFPSSDISAMIHTESEDLRIALAQRIQEVKAQYPDQNLSDETLIKLTVPRSVQSEHDFREWASRISELGFNMALDGEIEKIQAARASKVESSPVEIPEKSIDDKAIG